MKKTKIVATIGPASQSQKMLRSMIQAGMNVCRLNFSHGDYAWHKMTIGRIRRAAKLEKINVAILADIQGPRVRIASRKPVELKKGESVFVTDEKSVHLHSYKKELLLDWQNFYVHVRKGDRILIEDGVMALEVIQKKKGGCVAKVLEPGLAKPRKGVNIPAISSHMGFLTPKDLNDLDFILAQNVDYVAVSFVGSAKDLVGLKNLMQQWKKRKLAQNRMARKKEKVILPQIISKIERRDAMMHLENIILESDAIMVARGDLAVELPQEKVALLQKDIVRQCLRHKKPVIVATQMMNSMIEYPRPTRAEISDVTNAVIDQVDAVMLSGESAQGKYPEKVVETMAKIIEETEKSPYNDRLLKTINKFAKMLFRAKRAIKRKNKVVVAKNLHDAIGFAVLRQEDVKIRLNFAKKEEIARASLVWGVE